MPYFLTVPSCRNPANVDCMRPGRKQHAARPAKWCPCPCPLAQTGVLLGSCKNTFMAAALSLASECLSGLGVSTSHILPHLDCMPKILASEGNGTELRTRLSATQPNWTELHCTSLSPSDYTGKDEWVVAAAALRCPPKHTHMHTLEI